MVAEKIKSLLPKCTTALLTSIVQSLRRNRIVPIITAIDKVVTSRPVYVEILDLGDVISFGHPKLVGSVSYKVVIKPIG